MRAYEGIYKVVAFPILVYHYVRFRIQLREELLEELLEEERKGLLQDDYMEK